MAHAHVGAMSAPADAAPGVGVYNEKLGM